MSRDSRTKVPIGGAMIEALARSAFGSATTLREARESSDGWYNAVYRVTLDGSGAPREAVLKVAPPADIPHLAYETDLMRGEIVVLEALGRSGVEPVPRLLAADLSRTVIDRDVLFMQAMPGVSFAEIGPTLTPRERLEVRRSIGRIAGTASQVTAAAHGYPAVGEMRATTWREAFRAMVAGLIDDAGRFGAVLPQPRARLAERFAAACDILEETPPRLTHFDLWDGNVLVERDGDGWRVGGVIDWERAFFGDPLADVVCLTLFEDTQERQALYEGLAEGGGLGPGSEDDERRLALYRAYLWLIMVVEAGPRGFGGSILLPGSKAARRLMRDLARAGV